MKYARLPLLSLSLLLCLCIGYAAQGGSQTRYVEDLEIRGYKGVSRDEILGRIKTRSGEAFSPEQAYQDFQRILDMRRFEKPQSQLILQEGLRGGVVVIFSLKENSAK